MSDEIDRLAEVIEQAITAYLDDADAESLEEVDTADLAENVAHAVQLYRA